MTSRAKKPVATAEEKALETRQRSLLDKEIADEEERFSALSRGKLGKQSLLSGAPSNPLEASTAQRTRGGAGRGISMLGQAGGDGGGSSAGGNTNRRPRTRVGNK